MGWSRWCCDRAGLSGPSSREVHGVAGRSLEGRRPLGVAIVGGLLISQLLTLYTTPVIYLYMERLRQRLVRRRSTEPVPAPAGPIPDPVAPS